MTNHFSIQTTSLSVSIVSSYYNKNLPYRKSFFISDTTDFCFCVYSSCFQAVIYFLALFALFVLERSLLSFFLLIRSLLFPPKILSHLSLFPAPLSVLRHAFLHFSSPLHRPFVLLHPCLSHSPYVLSFFHIIMYAHVCGCGSAASFASLQVSSPLYIIKGTENK